MLKPKQILKTMDNNDTDIYLPTIHDKYAARPNHVEDLCLAGFVANYSTVAHTQNTEEDHEVTDEMTEKTITLKHAMEKCRKGKIQKSLGITVAYTATFL